MAGFRTYNCLALLVDRVFRDRRRSKAALTSPRVAVTTMADGQLNEKAPAKPRLDVICDLKRIRRFLENSIRCLLKNPSLHAELSG
jgi:hypothetical protein